jgi:hypothetical protein
MPGKRRRSTTSNKKNSGRSSKGREAKIPRNKARESTSGSQSSSLDPRRKGLIQPDERSSETVKGRLSGDVQNLSQDELSDSESVEELVEEGQDFEGELIEGIENAPPADQGDIRTHGSAKPDVEPPDYKNRNRL